jgi:hypothetical protein
MDWLDGTRNMGVDNTGKKVTKVLERISKDTSSCGVFICGIP